MTVEEEYKKLKSKRGRKSQAQRDRLEELEQLMANAQLEGADVVPDEEPVVGPETAVGAPMEAMGNARVLTANLTVPTPEGHRNYPQGTVVTVPKDFLDAMIKADRLEPV